jgi:hypothetical protein
MAREHSCFGELGSPGIRFIARVGKAIDSLGVPAPANEPGVS